MTTIKILLCCAAGMSTSMIVKKMRQSAGEKGLDVTIDAIPSSEFDAKIPEYDCCLVGPQIKYLIDDLKQRTTKPVSAINSMDYGMMRGDKILADVLAILKR